MAKSAAQKAYEKAQKRARNQHAGELVAAGRDPRTVQYKPAYGTYDPALDQQERAATRGLGYLTQDTEKQGSRDTVDYGLGVDQVNRDAGRSLADLLTARTQGTADHATAIANLQQSYARLGNTQRQQQSAAGVMGGAAAQAAQKRAANETHDQAPIDTNFNRFLESSTTAEQRLGENKSNALGDLLKNYTRGSVDRTDTLTRAKAENTFYGQDINELKVDQAKQAGLLPVGGSQHPQTNPVVNPRKKRPMKASVLGSLTYGKAKL